MMYGATQNFDILQHEKGGPMNQTHPHFLLSKRKVEEALPGCHIKNCTKHATVCDGDLLYCAGCASKSEGFRKKHLAKGGLNGEEK